MSAAAEPILGPSKYRVTYNLARTNAAEFSLCGRYRYLLRRCFDGDVLAAPKNPVLFVMLNPSTADALWDDPTIRKCRGFAAAWDCGSLEVVNLYAWRATDPKELAVARREGLLEVPENREAIYEAVGRASLVVAAWGAHSAARLDCARPPRNVLRARLDERGLTCHAIRISKDGQPCHPLYMPYTERLKPYEVQP